MGLENSNRKESKDRISEGSSAREISNTKFANNAFEKYVFSSPIWLTPLHASFYVCTYNLPKSDSSALKFYIRSFILMSPTVQLKELNYLYCVISQVPGQR